MSREKVRNPWKLLSLALVVVLLGLAVWLWQNNQADQTNGDNNQTPALNQEANDQETETEASEIESQSYITGSLTYPSEVMPGDLVVIARNLSDNQEYTTSEHLQGSQYQYGYGYKLAVPPGDYHVFSRVDDRDAYYTNYITCGMSVECEDHSPIVVTVGAGQTVGDIMPGDWYAEN